MFTGTAQAGSPLDMCDSGSWYEPASDGQGLSVEVTQTLTSAADRPDVVVYYYTYDAGGYPFWLVGVGNRVSYNSSKVDLYFRRFYGRFPPDYTYIEGTSVDYPAGTGTFHSSGMFNWVPGTILQNHGMEPRNWQLVQLISPCD
jgi:hypothetical protein